MLMRIEMNLYEKKRKKSYVNVDERILKTLTIGNSEYEKIS